MRLIDADSMKADLLTVDPRYEGMIQWCITVLDAQPTIEERKTGMWIYAGTWTDPYTADKEPICQCSVCGQEVIGHGTSNFCSKCGAKMEI